MRLGIDFGTCYSSAALMSGDRPVPVRIDYNTTSLASSVFVTESNEVLVGQDADDHALENPARLRREFKRDLGSPVPYLVGDRQLLPEDLVALLLAKLKERAEAQLASERRITEAVLTVPAAYQKVKRGLMERAARQAGFEEVLLLHEPVAAGIYFDSLETGRRALDNGAALLVYDLGGGTFDVALVCRRQTTLETLAPPLGSDRLGGSRFDDLILDDMRRHASSGLRRSLDPAVYAPDAAGQTSFQRACLHARDESRQLKHKLTSAQQGRVFFGEPPLEAYSLSRADFERLIAPLVAETLELCRSLIVASGLDSKELAGALLVGGSCRIPYIRDAVERTLGCPAFLADDPALTVCLGAALYGAGSAQAGPPARWIGPETFDDPFDAFRPR